MGYTIHIKLKMMLLRQQYNEGCDLVVLELIRLVWGNLLYFALHISGSSSFPKPLTAKEEQECLQRIKQGDEQAKNKLIEHNLRLVAHIVKKYYAAVKEQDDLISIGTIGLIKAVSTFNADKGTRFATYASRCIEKPIPS